MPKERNLVSGDVVTPNDKGNVRLATYGDKRAGARLGAWHLGEVYWFDQNEPVFNIEGPTLSVLQ